MFCIVIIMSDNICNLPHWKQVDGEVEWKKVEFLNIFAFFSSDFSPQKFSIKVIVDFDVVRDGWSIEDDENG